MRVVGSCLKYFGIGAVACPHKLQNSGSLWPYSWTRCCWKFLSPHMSTSIAMVLRYKILQNRLTKWWPNIGEDVCICGSFHFRTFLGVLLVGQFYRRQPRDWTNRLHSHVQVGSWLCHLGAVQFRVSWSDFEGICSAIVTFGLTVLLSGEFVLLPTELRVYGEFEKLEGYAAVCSCISCTGPPSDRFFIEMYHEISNIFIVYNYPRFLLLQPPDCFDF